LDPAPPPGSRRLQSPSTALCVRFTTLALHWLQKAARKGDDVAQYWLGKMYSEGIGVPVNLKRAFRLFERAAKHGLVEAQYEVGVAYAEGRGVTDSNAHAVKWFRAGAEQGHAPCQCKLGIMYVMGFGVSKDEVAAREWLDKSAAQGFPESLFLLDAFYPDKINGPRVPPEIVPEVEQFVKDLAKLARSESPE
jgi:TPR repeat protein